MSLLTKKITVTTAEGQTRELAVREWTVPEQDKNAELANDGVLSYIRRNLDEAGREILLTLGLREANRIQDEILKLNWGTAETVTKN